jgi:ABC exporter DevB family membrane fusion protein
MTRTATLTLTALSLVAAAGLLAGSRTASSGPAGAGAPSTTEGHLPTGATLVAAPGRVEPLSEEIDVAAEVSGRIRELLVEEGDRVESGQVIARLAGDDHAARVASAHASVAIASAELDRLVNGARQEERREATAAASQADAQLRHAERELDRRRGLAAEGVISREELDRAERDVDVARARAAELRERAALVGAAARADELARARASLDLARARLAEALAILDKTVVRSPIAGVVLRRHRQAGEHVSVEASQGSLLVTVADTSVLHVRVDVDERDVARLRVGQPAFVTADAYPGQRLGGHVVRVGQLLGRKNLRTDEPTERVDTKVLETLVELDAGVRLPVGLRVDAFIDTAGAGR